MRQRPFTDGADPSLRRFLAILWPDYAPPGVEPGGSSLTCNAMWCSSAVALSADCVWQATCPGQLTPPPRPPTTAADASTAKQAILPDIFKRVRREVLAEVQAPGVKCTLNIDGFTGAAGL